MYYINNAYNGAYNAYSNAYDYVWGSQGDNKFLEMVEINKKNTGGWNSDFCTELPAEVVAPAVAEVFAIPAHHETYEKEEIIQENEGSPCLTVFNRTLAPGEAIDYLRPTCGDSGDRIVSIQFRGEDISLPTPDGFYKDVNRQTFKIYNRTMREESPERMIGHIFDYAYSEVATPNETHEQTIEKAKKLYHDIALVSNQSAFGEACVKLSSMVSNKKFVKSFSSTLPDVAEVHPNMQASRPPVCLIERKMVVQSGIGRMLLAGERGEVQMDEGTYAVTVTADLKNNSGSVDVWASSMKV